MSLADRVRVKNVHVLSDRHYRLEEVEFDYRRGNGEWQTMKREVFDRGHAATLLAYNVASRTVVLTRQFRLPPYRAGHDDLMIEAAAGMLDDETPENRIRAEAEEEIGYLLHDVRKVFEAFMSPGSVTEKLHFFVAEYEAAMRVGDGGGLADEGEDIEVLELPIDQALAMILDGRIVDAKTIMLLQYAALNIFR
ncbi:NUDIX domain-containing protein [Bradyrhizobium sp. LMTR 3]|uniref:NUDIX domain-containing protein n=1 Tax=Bradyrhizobium sp. LMTR 3 TaxID=189873 RepID=UPI0008105214|nr:NUDIX domain-containing protein [Bradyrhizobium sp. LMTR 3]OCK60440.1 GDP-mannose pyrophosphatase [Bradyrhizobium sp. LMTR 3]